MAIVNETIAHAHAAWLGHIVQMEAEQLAHALKMQEINLNAAIDGINALRNFISDPSHILGSQTTKHGEIAEACEVFIGNALEQIKGGKPIYIWLNGAERFAPADYLLNGAEIQSKYINGAAATVNHIKKHLEKYQDFLANGGHYHIPKDRYMEITKLLAKKSSELQGSQTTLVRNIRAFEKATGFKFERAVNPAITTYGEVQLNKVDDTIAKKEEELKKIDKKLRQRHIEKARPTMKAGLQAATIGAALEGGTALVMSIAKRHKKGLTLADYTSDDWLEIAAEAGVGVVKGSIRGGGVYSLTKIAGVPAPAATAVFSASFGVIEQANRLRKGEIGRDEFVLNAEALCLDVTIGAVASAVGQALIPLPVLGSLVGNSIGMLLWGIAKNHLQEEEQKVISCYRARVNAHNLQLDSYLKEIFDELNQDVNHFQALYDMTFDVSKGRSVNFHGSICLAHYNNVSTDAIIRDAAGFERFLENNIIIDLGDCA